MQAVLVVVALGIGIGLALGESSCSSLFCKSDCDSAPTPVRGDPSMFTLAGVEREDYGVSALAPCGPGAEYVSILGTGPRQVTSAVDGGCEASIDCSETWYSATSGIYARLRERGVEAGTGYGLACGAGGVSGTFAKIYDYAQADTATQAIGDLLAEKGLKGAIYLTIGPMEHACPQTACGY